MSNNAHWIAGTGVGLTWTACFGTEVNSLASAYNATGSVVIANGTPLDLYADVSFSVTGTTGSSGVPYLALYLLPLNQDGTTYGDSTASGAVQPGGSYLISTAQLPLNKTSAVMTGAFRGIVMPAGSFVFALVNGSGNALSSSGNTIKYRTYNENLNGA